MKRSKSFENLLTDLHSDPLPDGAMPGLSGQTDGVIELSALTEDEVERLVVCEQTIAEGLDTFLAVGNALLEIQRGKLYRSSHRTFEGYCRERFQLKRQRAYELMGAAEVVNSLSEISDKTEVMNNLSEISDKNENGTILSEISDKTENQALPARESHASVLAGLPVEVRRDVWAKVTQEARQTEKPITATRIKSAISQHTRSQKADVGEGSPASSATNQRLIKQIKKATADAARGEIRVEVNGSWLKRHGLEDTWRELRNRPDWVINETFVDHLSLKEARILGLMG